MITNTAAPTLRGSAAARSRAALSPDERVLFGILVVLVVIVAFPGKFLFYISPGVAIVMSLFVGQFINCWRLMAIVTALGALSVLTMSLDAIDGANVNWLGLALGLITYLPIFILWSPAKNFRVSDALMRRVATMCAIFIFLQAGLGALQMIVGGDPDFISGTFGLFDFATQEKTISQVNYCFTLFCMVLLCAIWLPKTLMLLACIVGVVAALVADAAHQTIFFLVLLPALAITGRQRFRRSTVSILAAGGLLAVALIGDPGIIRHAQLWANRVLFAAHSPKRLAVLSAVKIMSVPKNLVLGVGLGQFSSRAAIFTSGLGTSLNFPRYLIDTSTYFDQYMRRPIELFENTKENSAMLIPYFSAVSIVTEFGIVAAAFLLIMTVVIVADNLRLAKINAQAQRISYYCNFFIGFLFLCCTIEDYLELTQAIMIPILLYIIAKARLRTLMAETVPVAIDQRRNKVLGLALLN